MREDQRNTKYLNNSVFFAFSFYIALMFTYTVNQKSVKRGVWWKIVHLYGIFQYFLVIQWLKKSTKLFSLKIKSSEKQKSVYILFLSNLINIESHSQNLNEIICNFQFSTKFLRKRCLSIFPQFSTEQRIFITLDYTEIELEN